MAPGNVRFLELFAAATPLRLPASLNSRGFGVFQRSWRVDEKPGDRGCGLLKNASELSEDAG